MIGYFKSNLARFLLVLSGLFALAFGVPCAFDTAAASPSAVPNCLGAYNSEVQSQSGGFVSLSSSPGGIYTAFTDSWGVHYIYIYHNSNNPGSGEQFSGIQFKVYNNGYTGTWIADTSNYLTLGNSQTGIQIGYNGCTEYPGLILTMTYFSTGSSDCTKISLGAFPGSSSGTVDVYDCNGNLLLAPNVYDLCVNGDVSACDGSCHCTVPAEQSTWGKIKAIYAE